MGARNDELVEYASRFHAHVGYEGFSNFDVKYDERNGSYKFFEVNTRPGRNAYYVSLAGGSFVRLFVDHYVLGREVERVSASNPFVFRMVPDYVISRTVKELDRSRALSLIRSGKGGCPIFCKEDTLKQRF